LNLSFLMHSLFNLPDVMRDSLSLVLGCGILLAVAGCGRDEGNRVVTPDAPYELTAQERENEARFREMRQGSRQEVGSNDGR